MKKWSNSQRKNYNATIRSRKANKTIVEIVIVYPALYLSSMYVNGSGTALKGASPRL